MKCIGRFAVVYVLLTMFAAIMGCDSKPAPAPSNEEVKKGMMGYEKKDKKK